MSSHGTATATALNARIPESLRRRLDIAVAQKGITIQQAVVEAITNWLDGPTPGVLLDAPVIRAKPGSLKLTREDIDAAILG